MTTLICFLKKHPVHYRKLQNTTCEVVYDRLKTTIPCEDSACAHLESLCCDATDDALAWLCESVVALYVVALAICKLSYGTKALEFLQAVLFVNLSHFEVLVC